MVVKRSEKIWTVDQDFKMSKHGPIFGDEIGKSIQMFHPIIEDVIMERIAAANPHAYGGNRTHAPLSRGLTMVYMYYSPHLTLLPLHAICDSNMIFLLWIKTLKSCKKYSK